MRLRQRSYLSEGTGRKTLLKKIRGARSIRELMRLARAAQKDGSSEVSSAWHEREHELKHGGRQEHPYFT